MVLTLKETSAAAVINGLQPHSGAAVAAVSVAAAAPAVAAATAVAAGAVVLRWYFKTCLPGRKLRMVNFRDVRYYRLIKALKIIRR